MIATERLLLREWRDADRDEFERTCNTPAVRAHLGGVVDPSVHHSAIDRMQALQAARGHCFWVIERKADGAFLGFCGIKMVTATAANMPETHEIGWRLREDAWGQGYAKEAAIASLDFAFGTLGAPRVVALTVEGNKASWGLMRRLGMTRRPDLDFHDPDSPAELNPTIVYVIEADRWTSPI